MKVTNIQERHVQALIIVLFATELICNGFGLVKSYKYKTETFFQSGTQVPPRKLAQTLSSLRIACASLCSPNSITSFALINIKSNRLWCASNKSLGSSNQNQMCNIKMRTDTLFKTKDLRLDHEGEKELIASIKEKVASAGLINITYMKKSDNEAFNHVINEKQTKREDKSSISFGDNAALLNNTLQHSKNSQNPNTKIMNISTRDAYFAIFGNNRNLMQILHIFNDTLSQQCYNNKNSWVNYPAVLTKLGTKQRAIVRPTVLSFGGMIVICGGNVFDKKNRKYGPINTCHSWQDISAKMQSFANLSWPRFFGEAIVNEDSSAFAIIGGRGTTIQFSNHFDIYRDGSFRLEKSTLPKMSEGSCIGSGMGMENAYIVSRAKSGSTKLHQVNRNNYKAVMLDSPSNNLGMPYTCSIFRDKYLVITSIVRKKYQLTSQVFDIHTRAWTKVISVQKSPITDFGKVPFMMHYLAFNSTSKILIFSQTREMYLVDPYTFSLLPNSTEAQKRRKIWVGEARPVSISKKLAQSVCKT